MSWKKWAAGTFGAAVVVSALAFANVAAANQSSTAPAVTQSSSTAPTTTESVPNPTPTVEGLNPNPVDRPFCGAWADPVPNADHPNPPVSSNPGVHDSHCFATMGEANAYFGDPANY
jgi:hypothetical protein